MLSKLTVIRTPKPSSRLVNHSPLSISPSKSRPSKSNYFKSRKLTLECSRKPKPQTSNEGTPSSFSVSESPSSHSFHSFYEYVLGFFSSPESATDYFFLNRNSILTNSEFFESFESLKLAEKGQNTLKFFNEACIGGKITRSEFLEKLVNLQNRKSIGFFKVDENKRENMNGEGIFRKKRSIKVIGRVKKESFLKKNIENFHLFIKRRKSGCSKNSLEKSIRKKDKKMFNMSLKLNCGIYDIFNK